MTVLGALRPPSVGWSIRPEGLFIPWAKRLPENRGAVVPGLTNDAPASCGLDIERESAPVLRGAFVANWLNADYCYVFLTLSALVAMIFSAC